MPEPIQLLRITGLLAVSVSALGCILPRLGSESGTNFGNLVEATLRNRAPEGVLTVLEIVAYVIWSFAFWRVTRPDDIAAPPRFSLLLLGLQSAIAVLFSTDLLYLGAAEVALLVPFPAGMVWVACHAVAEVGVYGIEPRIVGPPLSSASLPAPLLLTLVTLGSITYHMLAYSLGLLGGAEIRQRRDLARANTELRAMQRIEADAARLKERLTIARELHDSIGHHLTALSINLQLATRIGPAQAGDAIDEAYMLSRLLLSDVRSVVTDLRDLNAVQLGEALRILSANIRAPAIHLHFNPAMDRALPPLVSHALFRCGQEIITNTLRHSGARNLWIRLILAEDQYEMHSRDDGHGTTRVVWGNGLTGMRERVEELGGSLRLSTSAGEGFTISLVIPRRERA